MKDCILKEIIEPILPIIDKEANKIIDDSEKYKLSFKPFTINLLYYVIEGIVSISQLATTIKTSPKAKELELIKASKSMYNEAFNRYSVEPFRRILSSLLDQTDFLEIPEIKTLGRFYLIDGSIFPAISTMTWASYKKKSNAIKLHLSFDLNHMIPVTFISTEANYSEKKAMSHMLEKGVTFIADRGYLAFILLEEIVNKQAHFIIRGKNKMLYEVKEDIVVEIPDEFSSMVSDCMDMKVVFTNDKSKSEYRVVSFKVMDEIYNLVTDRFDLTTYEVIMLYAYRWQIELAFRFIKRTVNGIHLINLSPTGIEIQFLLYIIVYLLLLNTKQKCNISMEEETNFEDKREIQETDDSIKETNSTIKEAEQNTSKIKRLGKKYDLVTMLGKRLSKYWKIGIHWLITLRNLLLEEATLENYKLLAF